MFRLPNKHAIFNRSVLWSVFLFSAALFVPWVLAETLPDQSLSKLSSLTPSPQSEPVLQPSPDPRAAEQEWHQRIASQSLSWERSPNPATSPTPAQTSNSKTNTSPSSAAAPETNKPKTNTPQSQAAVSTTKSKPSQPSSSVAKAQAPESSKTSHQSKSTSHRSSKNKTKTAQSSHTASSIDIRVAIATGEKSLVVGTSTGGELRDGRGKVLGKLPANEAANVVPNGAGMRVGKWETPAGVWVKPSQGGFVFVGDRWYRGDLLLVSQGNTLLAVNYVDLESYIASVVGCEVSPSWPMDALKAQAIAARSYALVHYLRPANRLYDLGNTQRWQVYRGVNSEWNTTRHAAEETKGVFLSYKGGVVESMYAANDEIVSKAHGGRGMSQNGALSMAQQGYNYQQILGKYYPGASLAWMDVQPSSKR
ncbi:SpoIID/LytB domain-containing protein [Microcoleus sp. ZQ-A2]|nr:SpoIID/LytB domain-containing protein [Microcoleus sp. FACHB-1]